ncbi:class I adenylate-forming enzyme family protein [Novosphingobium sp. BL-52-GroH]|uniref:class I adenylate-forming enzyme family protein n=1 Tax=Novosphingobium sp. BL-52-GroH TaxID=3349877 RepID=UPI00384DA280
MNSETTMPASRTAEIPFSYRAMTVGRGVKAAATREPSKIAVRFGEETRSYGELAARIDRLGAAALDDLCLVPGDRAAIIARNRLEYIEVVCGLPEAGVAVATVNARLTVKEIVAICDDAGARVAFVDPDLVDALRAADFASVERLIAFGPEYESWLAGVRAEAELPDLEEWDVWTIPYTSGTTGKPKGVMVSHRSRVFNFAGMAATYGCFGPDDRFLALAPLNHGGGLGFTMASLFYGGSIEILDKFEPEVALRKLKFGGFTGIFMVPTHFQMIFELPQAVLDECRRPPLRTIISNAAPLPQAMKERIVPYFGETVLHECYGSTEGAVIATLPPQHQLRKNRCVGLPFACTEVSIRDEAGEECPPEQVGELFSRSPYLFNGYWKLPAETRAAYKDGWVSVGDMARRDEEGFIYIVDRKKDMVISGGVNIYPREIEEVLLHHPAIADVAVVGIPDDRWGERLKAFVVPRGGIALTADDIAGFCAGRLAAYKVPRDLTLLDVLPRNTAGKILKTELRLA